MLDLSNMRDEYLPMYLHSVLVFMFSYNPHDSQSNMHSGYLPPYLHSSLVHILGSKTFPICMVDIYHRICIVDWCLFSSTILMIPNPICTVDIYHRICTVVWCIFVIMRAEGRGGRIRSPLQLLGSAFAWA